MVTLIVEMILQCRFLTEMDNLSYIFPTGYIQVNVFSFGGFYFTLAAAVLSSVVTLPMAIHSFLKHRKYKAHSEHITGLEAVTMRPSTPTLDSQENPTSQS